ncbi:MAG: sporulation protein YtfJ [Clostridia bacterium]|nr:sporulation protein YtfJ [Clostridia bacterium]MBR5742705.1 sporulation protein YtfJ [Clostridia bacterium]
MEQNNKSGKINSLLETTLSRIRELVDSQTVIGEPIVVSPRLTLIPISKMSFGFASGGSDFSGKNNPNVHFGGGSGAGVTVNPLGFLSIADQTEVTFVSIGPGAASPVEGLIAGLPGAIGKLKDMFGKKDGGEEEEESED